MQILSQVFSTFDLAYGCFVIRGVFFFFSVIKFNLPRGSCASYSGREGYSSKVALELKPKFHAESRRARPGQKALRRERAWCISNERSPSKLS